MDVYNYQIQDTSTRIVHTQERETYSFIHDSSASPIVIEKVEALTPFIP